MVYIDYDGVIMDTEDIIFEEYRKNPIYKEKTLEEKIEYLKHVDWECCIKKAKVINNAIEYLKQMNPDTHAILTRVHSIENEGAAKIKHLREAGVKLDVILVPYNLKKVDVVNPIGNILIDDGLRNLTEWEECGGIPIFIDIDGDNIDPWLQVNTYGFPNEISLEKYVD